MTQINKSVSINKIDDVIWCNEHPLWSDPRNICTLSHGSLCSGAKVAFQLKSKPDGLDVVYVVPAGLEVKRIRVQKGKYSLELVREENYPESFVRMIEESYEYTLNEPPPRIASAHVWDIPESIQKSKHVL